MNIERVKLRAAKSEDALACDRVDQLFSNVSVVKKAADDEVYAYDKERQAPEFKKPIRVPARFRIEGSKPDHRIPKNRKSAPHKAEWNQKDVISAKY